MYVYFYYINGNCFKISSENLRQKEFAKNQQFFRIFSSPQLRQKYALKLLSRNINVWNKEEKSQNFGLKLLLTFLSINCVSG